VTLPVETLERLATIDSDRARAIVKAAEAAIPPDPTSKKLIEVVEVERGLGVIVVGPSKLLQRIEGLRMVEVAPLRFLLTIPLGTAIDSLELGVIDLLESDAAKDEWERSLVLELRDLIRNLRQRRELSKAELLLVDTRNTVAGVLGNKRTEVASSTAPRHVLTRS
jgi:hypothetical protein